MAIQLLGPLRVTVDGQPVELPRSRKARALLAMLALERRDHFRAQLCASLWPETSDPRADLRWSLSRLRRVLGGESIVAAADAVRLEDGRVVTDVQQLQHLLNHGPERESVPALLEHCSRMSSEPLHDLHGPGGVEFELWRESQRQRLRRLQLRALAVLTEALQEDPAAALEVARQRVAMDPLGEAAAIELAHLTLRTAGRQQAQSVLEQCRRRLRQAGLADTGLLAAWYRLGRNKPPTPLPAGVSAGGETGLSLPQKPSLAVIGFDALGTAEDGMLAEGLSVDLTSSLARLKGLFVIARASAARFSLTDLSARDIGHRLGVRYLIHGSTRRLGSRLRVTVDLLECAAGEQIWAEVYERTVHDLFAVQDEIVDAIVAALEPQIEHAERERARLLPTDNLNAWECFHRAMWHNYRFTPADTREAHRLLQRALKEDPGFARAYAGLSFNHFNRAFLDTSADPAGDVRQALETAHESVSLEPRDAVGHWSLGRALLLDRSHDQALAGIDRALNINPNYAQGHYARGFVGCHAGQAKEIYTDLDMAQRLSPFDPLLFAIESSRAIALAVNGRQDEAAHWAVRATQQPNAHFHIFAIAAACLHLAGRQDQAAQTAQQVLDRHPDYRIAAFERSFPHKSESDRRVMSDALRAAGLPP